MPAPGRGSTAPELQRAMVLVCMKPKAEAAPGYAENRLAAFREGVGGGHGAGGIIKIEEAKQGLVENGRWDNHGKFRRIEPAKLDAAQMELLV